MAKEQYFVKVTANAPGNRLCKKVEDYVRFMYDRVIVDADDFEKVKEDVVEYIDAAMKEFSRCRKPILSANMVGGVGEGLHPQLALMKANNDSTAVFIINTDIILWKVEFKDGNDALKGAAQNSKNRK